MSPEDAARFAELEIKIAFLEKHVGEQDRAMMEMTRELDRLKRATDRLADTVKNAGDSGAAGAPGPFDERPPHY